MASRLALHDVGSSQWIVNEIAEVHRREVDHLEDFTIAVRNELEWLNEHMSDIFSQGSKIDLVELYKTPGKLRGKTPRNLRRFIPIDDQNNEANSPTQLPIGAHTTLFTYAAKPLLHPSKPIDYNAQSGASTPELIRDSGAWTGSTGSRSLAGSFATLPDEPVERCSPAKKPAYQEAPVVTAETAERRTFSDATRGSYLSAQEELIGDQGASNQSSASEIENSDTPNCNTYVATNSVRLVEEVHLETDSSAAASRPPRKEPFRTPQNRDVLQITHRQSSVSPIQTSSPPPQLASSPISPIRQQDHGSIRTPKTPANEQGGESETPSEAASPAGLSRSSMNFASLPARETLTHKKSMGGVNTTGSRNSQVDDRMSFFGRLTGGKSLGASSITGEAGLQDSTTTLNMIPAQASPNNLSDEEDDDYNLNEQLRLAEINKASVMQLSEKTSTQRLNEKISQLNQQGTNRLSKSTSTSSLPSSVQSEDRGISTTAAGATSSNIPSDTKTRESIQSDEGDWVSSHPQLVKAKAINTIVTNPSSVESSSPLIESNWRVSNEDAAATPNRTTAISTLTKLPLPISTIKRLGEGNISYPTLPTSARLNDSVTPLETKLSSDMEVTTAKKNQATIFSFAKQLLWRSGRSESPKPNPSKSPSKQMCDDGPASQISINASDDLRLTKCLYPEIRSPVSHGPLSRVFGKTSDQSKDFQTTPQVGTYDGRQEDGLVSIGDILKREVQLEGPSPAVIDGINLIPENIDDLVRSPDISDNELSLPASPFSDIATTFDEADERDQIIGDAGTPRLGISNFERNTSSSSPQFIKTDHATPQSSQESTFQKPLYSKGAELKKPNRGIFGVKDSGVSKPKALSQNPRLVSTLQREIDHKTGVQNPPSSATLVSALADTFGPSNDPNTRPPSMISIASSQSIPAPKSKSIAALNSAAKAQKREQEEKERKAAQKLENERRRQENLKREEARREEERKQQASKATKKQLSKIPDDDDTKKRPPGISKGMQPLLHSSKLLAKTAHFSQKGPLGTSKSHQELKRQQKRLFPPDEEGKASQEKLTKDLSHQQSKRRKTEDISDTPASSTLVPPIRQSTAKKENLPPSKIGGIFSQDYTPAPHPAQYNPGSSLVKSTLPPPSHPTKMINTLPQVDAVKYSHDKLKFGTMATPAPRTGKQSIIPRESPIYPNPESIELPEIHTDSEDDEEDKSFRVPKWADSPELRQALQDQLGIDPETIFGPIAPLSMEDIFKGRTDRVKFRARTSSANWSGADRLTAAEIEADRLERQRILDNGGWTYKKPT
ncbi:hypothetical protein TWF694_011895 [Orbilia ellipsospora]|uniref:Inner centromere protein ARK-binding domain-containing protein n=1 Tax=Orbilia ellipsospora TaxID=2528407 RepID=A0AAV9X9I4_9PEZI